MSASIEERIAVLESKVSRNEKSVEKLNSEVDQAVAEMRKTLTGILVSALIITMTAITTLLLALVGVV